MDETGDPIYGWKKAGTSNGYGQLIKGMAFTPSSEIYFVAGESATIQVIDSTKDAIPYLHHIQGEEGEDHKVMPEVTFPGGVAVMENMLLISEKIGDRILVYELK